MVARQEDGRELVAQVDRFAFAPRGLLVPVLKARAAYVRGPRGEDLSYFFAKVVFHLHQSFEDPIRGARHARGQRARADARSATAAHACSPREVSEVATFPFELSESGWGEFDMMIRLVFRDPSQAPLDIMHHLKLYPTDGSQMAIGQVRWGWGCGGCL